MKPKTKFQRQVVETSKSLPAITDAQVRWAYKNCVRHIGRRNAKGEITCTECGHRWQGEGELISTLLGCDCPNCKTKLTVQTTKKRVFGESYYMTVITAHRGFQVVRTVLIKYAVRVGEPPKYTHREVMQRWIAPNGKHCTFALLRQTMGTCYCDAWILYSDLELRSENANNKFYTNVYDRIPTGEIYPRIKLIPELKRTGYKKGLYGQNPSDLYRTLLSDSRAETLMKTGNTKLLKRLMDTNWRNIDRYWASVRICIRNGYKIQDAPLWCDYIDFLHTLGKDLYNAKYVCPTDLKAEHDRYMLKKAKADARRDWEKQRGNEAGYRDAKAKFFGLVFSDGTINVRVLESVAEIILEGKVMHHCVGSYHDRPDSLILSATIGGERIETVEVSLSKLSVIQCRGVCNSETEYHNRIIDLVNRNIPVIQQRLAA